MRFLFFKNRNNEQLNAYCEVAVHSCVLVNYEAPKSRPF